MAGTEDDVKSELLLLYRNNFALRQDQKVAAEKITTMEGALESMQERKRQLTAETVALEAKNQSLDLLLTQSQAKVAQLESQLVPIATRNDDLEVARASGARSGSTPARLRIPQSPLADTAEVLEDQLDYIPELNPDGPDAGQRLPPRSRKRRRTRPAEDADEFEGADDETEGPVQAPEGATVTAEDLRAAFPDEFAELDRVNALEKGTWRTCCIFELGSQLLQRLDLCQAPRTASLHARFPRPLGATGKTLSVSAWDVLAVSGCHRSEGTYGIYHMCFTRMRSHHEHFFAHASGAERLQRVSDTRARKILEDLHEFFDGSHSGPTGQWIERMRSLERLLPDPESV
ncbi:hypothetical protein AURDEDRAFT_169871 [Auricularia subglabra TFB-10046 SS5]|nr:hypothetical protein AURDEDRAFT_169871 [Auricularia subglabra TFB-10046 SS5]